MSRIDTQIWKPHPEKPGYVCYVGQRKASEVFAELEAFLKEENIYPDEYFLMTDFELPDMDFPKGNIRCYAQWGGSEGIYLEVDVLVPADDKNPSRTVNFATGKTLDDSSEAFDRMQYIAGRIYKAFCGDGVTSPRYCIVPGAPRREITYSMLIGKLEQECRDYMRSEMLHKRTPLSAVSKRTGLMLTVLAVIKEPITYADLPLDKIEELYHTENILQKICDKCESVSTADIYEIGDIIASAPSFAETEGDTLERTVEKTESTAEREDLYYGFTHFDRMEYRDIPHSDFVEQVTFGLYAREGGCVCELSVQWEYVDDKLMSCFRIADDSIKESFKEKFLSVVDQLRHLGVYSPIRFCKLLLENGFEDDSDIPLQQREQNKTVRLQKPMIDHYEEMMKAEAGDPRLEEYAKYTTVERWTIRFDAPGYEADLKVCSSGHGEPLWCELVLFHNGNQVGCSDPESELQGEWWITADGMEFNVTVEAVEVE